MNTLLKYLIIDNCSVVKERFITKEWGCFSWEEIIDEKKICNKINITTLEDVDIYLNGNKLTKIK